MTGTTATLDAGLQCLIHIAQYHGIRVEQDQLLHQWIEGNEPFDENRMLLGAQSLGMQARRVRPSAQRLNKAALPAVARMKNGDLLLLAQVHEDRVLYAHPLRNRPEYMSLTDWHAQWEGGLVVFTSKASLSRDLMKFDFSWFIPAIIKYRHLLIEVLLVSLVLQFFALVTPLFFQVVTDKVLVNQVMSTLNVITIALVVVTLFEVGLTVLRTYVFAHTTSRIDVELGAALFKHLMSLPMAYFQARRVGDSVARVRELENIRSFLTGHAITLVLDVVFSVVFIAVMFYYSTTLTWLVLLSLPCYVLISLLVTPPLRQRLDAKFQRGAENQAFLVETVGAAETVKSMALETRWQRKWEQQLAAYVHASFRTTALGNLAHGGVELIGKLVSVLVVFMGAKEVMEGRLTIGQLIAFNMLSNHVSAPIMRMAQLWTDFQQVGISMQRLGDILNTRTEIFSGHAVLPRIQGDIQIKDVRFRYRPDMPLVLNDIHVHIKPGQVVGFVGRSGSGKSTLTKLIQRLHSVESGRILIDDVDMSLVDASSLRRQIGVVLQENVLFSASIRDNIAVSDPTASMERVIATAKLAGAHDFISSLPEAYETLVGEHGATLSGGQRQRIAIARALLNDPRILIFDEATSALDYESERVIQDNMHDICAGRTVLIIAHRLSTMRVTDWIFVIDQGRVVEEGVHRELMRRPGGLYAHLHALQSDSSNRAADE